MAGKHRAYRRPGVHNAARLVGQATAITMAAVAATAGINITEAGTASADPGVNWDAVAACESGGNWATNTGNGFLGGLQFTPSTWRANGGTGSPAAASRGQQIAVANRVLATQGIRAWPTCGPRGLGSTNPTVAPLKRIAPSVQQGSDCIVMQGQTLAGIAAARGTTWQQIWAANRDTLPDPDLIVTGQSLRIS
jgi:nucleoid-associated protein YgaU